MPMALVFAFTMKMGIMGLWLGFTIACVILDIGFAMIISCPDWYKIADDVRAQLATNQHPATNAIRNFQQKYS